MMYSFDVRKREIEYDFCVEMMMMKHPKFYKNIKKNVYKRAPEMQAFNKTLKTVNCILRSLFLSYCSFIV